MYTTLLLLLLLLASCNVGSGGGFGDVSAVADAPGEATPVADVPGEATTVQDVPGEMPPTADAVWDVSGDVPVQNDLHVADADVGPQPAGTFNFAVIADPHIIDDFYPPGPDNGDLNIGSLFETRENLAHVRDHINLLNETLPLDFVLVAGDLFHNYPKREEDWDWYMETRTRMDIAREILDGLHMPWYWTPGNHDYDVPSISREFSHRLFKEKYGTAPFYALEHKGWRFLACNSQVGETWDPESPLYNKSKGSFGAEQLLWVEEQLALGQPTVAFWHHPFFVCATEETGGANILSILETRDNLLMSFTGHTHLWMNAEPVFQYRTRTVGSTRYDRDAYLIVQAHGETRSLEYLNDTCIQWGTNWSDPYFPDVPCVGSSD
jgi:3',5'-cyclic AMP phosphodiesterase CpdA